MINKCILMGRLTRDPELRHTASNTPVTTFTLAVDRGVKRTNDPAQQTADFIDIVAWRNTAEFVSKYFSKGRMAVVEGSLQMRDWTDKENNKRRSAEVIANNVYFADSKKENSDGFSGGEGTGYSDRRSGSDFAEIGEEDGELPF